MIVDGQLVREAFAEGVSILLGLLTVVGFWALCSLVHERATRRRDRSRA